MAPSKSSTKRTPRTTKVTTTPQKPSLFQSIRDYLSLKVYQYELLTGIYMLTGPEKLVFNIVVWTMVFLSCWTVYNYGAEYFHGAVDKARYYFVEL